MGVFTASGRAGQARNCKNLPHNESVSGRSTKTGTLVHWKYCTGFREIGDSRDMITLMKNTTMFNGVLRGFTNDYWDFVSKPVFSNLAFYEYIFPTHNF